RLEGTRLGRQELAGELLDAEELGVVKRSQWKPWDPKQRLPPFEIIVMSLDTAMTEENVDVKTQHSDYTACSVWGGFREAPTVLPRDRFERSEPEVDEKTARARFDLDLKPKPKIL